MDFERKAGGPPPAHSKYDPSYVAAFYDRDPESEWLRLVRSPLEEIKLHIHEHYLRKYMTSEMRVLEIGAGPGRFTKTLHELGCSVVVGDISAKQLEANKEKARELGFGASVERWVKIIPGGTKIVLVDINKKSSSPPSGFLESKECIY